MNAPVVSSTPSSSKSRRALLAGALGGLGAWVASAVGRASPVRAEGETMVVGGEYYTATSPTILRNQTNSSVVFSVSSAGAGAAVNAGSSSGIALYGASNAGTAVYGGSNSSTKEAIRAESGGDSTGLYGLSGIPELAPPAKAKTGVYGHATQDAGSKGVWGFSSRGAGVYGQASFSGFAVRANGRVKADKVSGVATIAAGSTSKTVSPGVNVASGSFVLLTPKANIGSRSLWFTTNPTDNKFTIRMSSSRSSSTPVAWLLLG